MIRDILIIGGGINGCAVAREAALHGLDILLVERDDLASHTSSASTKLIHGGLRYLEHREFGLVREALAERERLIRAAPHLIRPIPFILPHSPGIRPWWFVRAGLYLYDVLAWGTKLPGSRGLRASDTAYRTPLKDNVRGFVYWDAFVDDARLTLANAIDAAENGADICTRTTVESARRQDGLWQVQLSDGRTVAARAIVNTAGPWVTEVIQRLGLNKKSNVRLVKGSHIVVPRIYDGDHAYIFQLPDRRIIFAIPWLGNYTQIGTTDIAVDSPDDAQIDTQETGYLCDAVNTYFGTHLTPADVVDTWSGIRPLYDDGIAEASGVTRDFVLELDRTTPVLLSVFGGKITTARHLAEKVMEKLGPELGFIPRIVTRDRPFPGGNMDSVDDFIEDMQARFAFLGKARLIRMVHAYGTRLLDLLAGVDNIEDMGADLGNGLTERELRWMQTHEWARTTEDVLDRRSKLRVGGQAELSSRVRQVMEAKPEPSRDNLVTPS